jgi:hypothetical protein
VIMGDCFVTLGSALAAVLDLVTGVTDSIVVSLANYLANN